MQAFAQLLDSLSYCAERNGKLALLGQYFRQTPDPDRGLALAALTDQLDVHFPMRRVLASLIKKRNDPVLFKLSRDYVGDTAETTALMWQAKPQAEILDLSLSAIYKNFAQIKPAQMPDVLENYLDDLDATGRWALLKFLSGALRVGVSARLAKMAIAQEFKIELSAIEEIWHALSPPYEALFSWAKGKSGPPNVQDQAHYRPVMLAHPIADEDWQNLSADNLFAEWKWDGVRVQIAARGQDVRLYSRQAEDISRSFPEIIQAFDGHHVVLDGELLIMRESEIAPFQDLQQRLNRKQVAAKMLAQFPAHVRLYDILWQADQDLRDQPLSQRRQHLEQWYHSHKPGLCDVSPLIGFTKIDELHELWRQSRAQAIEGLMLKRADSPYLAGRPKGHWFKWKRAALTMDCVLMYAERGAGKRSSLYSNYTFGCWNEAGELVPVGKAYSGFTDQELKKLDQFIRENTIERFGPVRAVKPGLVFEVAFDAIHASKRHKSGLAMRFPRIHRIRWDKPAHEADPLRALQALIE